MVSLEYRIHVHGIFLNFFLNRNAAVVKDEAGEIAVKAGEMTPIRLDTLEEKMKSLLAFFSDWRLESLTQEDPTKSFLASATWINLRVTITGFIAYAKSVLTSPHAPTYVPFLHSNTSSLENVFSQVRGMNRDSAARYGGAILATDIRPDKNALATNKMYIPAHIGSECEAQEDLPLSNNIQCPKGPDRDSVYNKWESRLSQSTVTLSYIRTDLLVRPTNESTMLAEYFETVVDNTHYSRVLLKRPDFSEIAKISIGTPHQQWIETLLNLSEDEQTQFDEDIQRLNMMIFVLYCNAMGGARGRPTFHREVYRLMLNQQKRAELSSQGLFQDPIMFCHLILTLTRWFWERLLSARSCREVEKAEQEAAQKPTQMKEVNRFVGWAVSDLLKNYYKIEDKGHSVSDCISFLKGMRIFHFEALNDPDYMRRCYYRVDALRNRGGLTLVSRSYFEWGHALMTVISHSATPALVKVKGNQTMEEARENIENKYSDLEAQFLECENEATLSEELKRVLFRELVQKCSNAMFGMVLDDYKNDHIGRTATSKSDVTLRGGLKALKRTPTV